MTRGTSGMRRVGRCEERALARIAREADSTSSAGERSIRSWSDTLLHETAALWQEIARWMHNTYPDTVLLPESDVDRTTDGGIRSGFDADFGLVIHPEHSALFNNGAAGILPWQDDREPCYFDADADRAEGTRALQTFLDLWDIHLRRTAPDRLIVLATADHDFSRLAAGPRDGAQLRAALLFLLTWGSIPSIYYGDEIGMRFIDGLPDTEGSVWDPRFNRAGCRTPMQWDDALPNAGFSTAPAADLYLPQDASPDRPTVEAHLADPDSLLHFVRSLVHLRREIPALRASATRQVLAVGYPFVYLRGGTHLVVINPHREPANAELQLAGTAVLTAGSGVELVGRTLVVAGFGHAVLELRQDEA